VHDLPDGPVLVLGVELRLGQARDKLAYQPRRRFDVGDALLRFAVVFGIERSCRVLRWLQCRSPIAW
jgi:hypothetical protein